MENFSGWSNKAIRHELPSLDEFDRTRFEFELKLRKGHGMYEREPEQEEQPALPDMELVNFIERMSVQERAEYKQKLLDEINDREKLVWLINEVNEVEEVE